MKEAKAYCPASLSFIFKYVPNNNIFRMGSIGIGCTIDKKVAVSILKNTTFNIFFNGKKIILPTVIWAVRKITDKNFAINIESPLPLGCGFGISGAVTLATLYALKKLLKLKMSNLELAKIAHQSEIVNKTGLGTVATQITGGLLIKKRAGIPAKFENINLIGTKLYAVIFGILPTPSVLGKEKKLIIINQAANKALDLVNKLKQKTIDKILDISYQYCMESELLTSAKVISLIERVRTNGGAATMLLLGQVMISNINLQKINGLPIHELTITDDTVKIL